MHHKRKKPRTEKQDPDKRLLPTMTRDGEDKEKTGPPAKLPRGYCKKLKGPHQFVLTNGDLYNYKDFYVKHPDAVDSYIAFWQEERCTGCEKKRLTRIRIDPITGKELGRYVF